MKFGCPRGSCCSRYTFTGAPQIPSIGGGPVFPSADPCTVFYISILMYGGNQDHNVGSQGAEVSEHSFEVKFRLDPGWRGPRSSSKRGSSRENMNKREVVGYTTSPLLCTILAPTANPCFRWRNIPTLSGVAATKSPELFKVCYKVKSRC